MKKIFSAVMFSMLLLFLALPGIAQIETRPVKFSPGTSSSAIKSTIQGDQTIDYTIEASANQVIKVNLTTNNTANYFNVLPPGSTAEAIFIGSTEGNKFAGTLSTSGVYTIRVYLMRSAARRNEKAKFKLDVEVKAAIEQ